MTYSVGRNVFFCSRVMLSAGVLALALAAGGCTSTTSADSTAAPVTGRGAQDTGTYPNLNIAPKVAAAQFTEDQKAAKLAELQAAKQRQGAKAGTGGGNSAAMTTLARKHGDDTLKAIEGKCETIDPACN
ncbi:hypothetical protein EDC40_105380 [Aminobacter aminovorans]|uniref:Lipoprotein n=2 Tax=Aminobacter aminovorans TaxID=83263 RepID=A0A380WMN3_AMIAI|nr:hypothetical protein EDC40_105380 [Aminobacter aminovorans]SUU90161.1 Uncharacterised protein [Aminobacter aminovorans]